MTCFFFPLYIPPVSFMRFQCTVNSAIEKLNVHDGENHKLPYGRAGKTTLNEIHRNLASAV